MEGGIIRTIILVVFCLLLCCPVASAGFELGIVDTLQDIVAGGLDKFLIGIADGLYDQTYRPENSTYNGTGTEIFIYTVTTSTTDPWKYQSIQDFRIITLILLLICVSINGFIGFIYVAISMVTNDGANLVDSMLNRSNTFRKERIKEYFADLMSSIVVVGFTDVFIQLLFALSYFVTAIFIIASIETKSLAPSADNVILYCAIAVFYYILDGVFDLRELLMTMFVMSSYLIGILLISHRTRDTGINIAYYLTGILFLQPIIVIITTMGFIGCELLCSKRGIVAGSVAEISIYSLLLIILVGAALAVIIGLVRLRKSAVRAVKLAI